MSTSAVDAEKLLRMAEQIAANIAVSDDAQVIGERTAEHLLRFWDPRMIEGFLAYVESAGPQLSVGVHGAVQRLRNPQAK